ncbi:IS1096 element passenger TnpR family protein [Pseudarthrobacter sp. O4]|uniref:IS1096 element passenger TnpR family protein n=1 Tax=Pseudarthrobacter sp. O4 TaxID=3418417 RepID=UPI003CEFA8CC
MGSEPVIWRLLEVDSSLTLDRIHDIIQAAVGWRDSHLHSFNDTDAYKRLRPVNGKLREPRRWVHRDLLTAALAECRRRHSAGQ